MSTTMPEHRGLIAPIVAQAFQPAGSGDFPVAPTGTGKFRQPADQKVCPTNVWPRSTRPNFSFRANIGTWVGPALSAMAIAFLTAVGPGLTAAPVAGVGDPGRSRVELSVVERQGVARRG